MVRASGGRLAGVRYSVGYDGSDHRQQPPAIGAHMYARPEIRAGMARLAAHGLVLDAGATIRSSPM